MLLRLFVCLAALWLAAGSAGPLELHPRFDRTGVYDPSAKGTPVVANADAVKVYYGTSPPGFTLRENELAVEPGYPHRILGTIKIEWMKGACAMGSQTKADVIRQLREAAYQNGGNAVIYARSALPDQPGENSCLPVHEENFGSGWAVVVGEPEAPPPAPAAPAAPAEPAAP